MKKHYKYILWGVLLTTTACSDDYFNKNEEVEYSEYIGYRINVTGNQFQSRTTGSTPTQGSRQLTIEATGASIGGRPLYLHTEVVDSIPMSISRAKKDTIASRGTITTSPNDIGISAVVFNGDGNAWPNADETTEAQMYMHNEQLTATGNWQTNRYWPRENNWIRFYAYSPYGILEEDGLPTISTTEPSFSYTVDSDITKQQDLLVGSEQYIGSWCKTAQLDMCHALAAVKIHIDGNVSDFTLKELTIEGLNNSGTYTYKFDSGATSDGKNDTQTHDAGVWTDQSGTAKYTLYHDETGMTLETIKEDANNNSLIDPETSKSTGYTDMTAGNMVLLMMPQTLTANAKITITGYDEILKQDGVTLSATIGDGVKQWEKGKMYTYTLSFSSTNIEYSLEVDIEGNVEIPYYGIKDKVYTVKSYKTVTRSGLESLTYAVPWEAVQVDNKGAETALPAGLQLAATAGPGVDLTNAQIESYTYCLLPNLASTNSKSHYNLKSSGQIPSGSPIRESSKAKPYDLSTEALYDANVGPKNTANSYMIFAPGYYTFPLVYGNAITNSNTNSSAYTSYSYNDTKSFDKTDYNGNKAETSFYFPFKSLSRFKDHANNDISGPWIVKANNREGRYTPTSAEIVWQDEPCLVTEVQLNETKDYITFRVHEETVCDGNAVIAVKDGNDVMWSWHIWVSDGNAYQEYGDAAGTINQQEYLSSEKSFSDIVNTNRRVISPNWKDCAWGQTAATGTYTGQNFHMSRVFLGHCDGETKEYQERTIKVRFKQVEAEDVEYKGTPKDVDVLISQKDGTVTTDNNIPYYQYGRKDPMLPAGNRTTDKIYYTNDWKQVTSGIKKEGGQATISDAIKHPEIFYAETSRSASNNLINNNWCKDGTYFNLWNTSSWAVPAFAYHSGYDSEEKRYEYHNQFKNLISCSVTKSVYDPCPPGYEMPRIDAFTGASFHGMNLYPLWYDNVTDPQLFAFTHEPGSDITTLDCQKGYHIYGNVWLNPYGHPYSADKFNTISIYSTAMTEAGTRGTGPENMGGESLPVSFFGHRTADGSVDKYGVYASALTCAPICTQNMNSTNKEMEDYAHFMLARLCIIKSEDKLHVGTGTWIPYSLRVFSASDFDYAFGIIPAKTGKNPSDFVVQGNPNWGGDHSDIGVGF